MEKAPRAIDSETYYKVAAAVFLQAIVTMLFLPGLEQQKQSLLGIVVIDAFSIGLAFLWKLSDSELQRLIITLSIFWWLKIYLTGG